MASLVFTKGFVNASAIAAMTGFASTALVCAGKQKAFALEKDGSSQQITKAAVPSKRKSVVSLAPEFDGLNCFETMVFK